MCATHLALKLSYAVLVVGVHATQSEKRSATSSGKSRVSTCWPVSFLSESANDFWSIFAKSFTTEASIPITMPGTSSSFTSAPSC